MAYKCRRRIQVKKAGRNKKKRGGRKEKKGDSIIGRPLIG